MKNGLIGVIRNTINNQTTIYNNDIQYFTSTPAINEIITIFSPNKKIIQQGNELKKITGIWQPNGNISLSIPTTIPAGSLLFQEYTYTSQFINQITVTANNTNTITLFNPNTTSGYIFLFKINANPGGNFYIRLNTEIYSNILSTPTYFLTIMYLSPVNNVNAYFTTQQDYIEADVIYMELGTNLGGV